MSIYKGVFNKMNRISLKSQYDFKTDFCRRCISNFYSFNGFISFIDILNGDFFNSDKMSWNSWYCMYSDDDVDKVYISTNQMMMR